MRIFIIFLIWSLLTSHLLFGIGKVTITGRIKGYQEYPLKSDKDEVSITSFDPYTSIYKAHVDRAGNFKLSFPKGFTGDVEFKFANNKAIQVMVSPGDKQYYDVESTALTTIVSFKGDNAIINQQMADYAKARTEVWKQNGRDQRPFSMTSKGIAQLEYPETFERKKAFLESYIQNRQLSPMFIKWAKTDLDYNYAARLFDVKTNEHQPISDPAFFKQFPMNISECLIASSYLNFLYVVRSSAIYWSPEANMYVVYGDDPVRTRFYNQLNKKDRQTFDNLLKYSNLSDSAIMATMQYPDSIEKYTIPRGDRFALKYIDSKTSGLVKDFFLANYILDELNKNSSVTPISYKYPRLVKTYKKSIPGGKYLGIINSAYKTSPFNPKNKK